jgi:peptidoglycan/LPS O-acetylase OafA/YrhL
MTAIEPSTAARPNSAPRLRELDSLRGLASVWVMLYHFTSNFDKHLGGHSSAPAMSFPWGAHGVDLFFMISGFVITMTAERRPQLKEFAFARFARLYPAYWAAVLFCAGLGMATQLLSERTTDWRDVLVNLTMIQQLFGVADVNGAFWTLYVELLFYGVVAGCLVCGRLRWLQPALLALAVVHLVSQAGNFYDRVPGWWRIQQAVPLLGWASLFAFGRAIYELRHGRSPWLTATMALLVVQRGMLDGHRSVAMTVALAAIFWLATSGRLPWLNQPWLVWLGTISYSLYLVHGNLGYVILRAAKLAGWDVNLSIGLAIVAAVATAEVFTFFVERPTHDALRAWWKGRSRPEVPSPAATLEPALPSGEGA